MRSWLSHTQSLHALVLVPCLAAHAPCCTEAASLATGKRCCPAWVRAAGYITNCGTEGNLHGILVGRENLPDGVLYASRETHYSVFKAARMYRMESVKARPALPAASGA